MKAAIFVLAGAIGLTGCTTVNHNRTWQSEDAGFPLTYSGNTKSEYPSANSPIIASSTSDPCRYREDSKNRATHTTKSCHDGTVKALPPELEEEARKATGIKDIAFMAVVGKDGKLGILRPNNAVSSRTLGLKSGRLNSKEIIPTRGITGFGSINIVSHRGSECVLVEQRTLDGGEVVEVCVLYEHELHR